MALLDSLADPSKPTCRTCRWWVPHPGQQLGECHFDAPKTDPIKCCTWPSTTSDTFCSHWLLSSCVLSDAA